MNNITLPSGISITQAKKNAKRLKRKNTHLNHSQALNLVLLENGYSGGWNKFISEAKEHKRYAGSKDPHRNLLVIATNHLVRESLISLEAPEDYEARQLHTSREKREKGHVFTEVAGRRTMISWGDVGFEELRISVWWDYDHNNHPQANHTGSYKEKFRTPSPLAKKEKYKDFVGVVCSGWLERKESKHLQGHNKQNLFQIYTRKQNREALKSIPKTKSLGYLSEGRFYM